MARAARDAGFEVHVATRVQHGADAIRDEGFVLHPVPFARGRLSPLTTLRTIRALRRVHDAVGPALAHNVSLQPVVLALLATLDRSVASVNAFIGFGYAFTSNATRARAIQRIAGAVLKFL